MIRRRRPTLRRGELAPSEKEAERNRVYDRCGGRCELRGTDGLPLDPGHQDGPLRRDGATRWDHWNLVHLHSKRRFGWSEAQGNILLGGCPACHLTGQHFLGRKIDLEKSLAIRGVQQW
jgi:hypothetical protein